jgi:hypothetical protein
MSVPRPCIMVVADDDEFETDPPTGSGLDHERSTTVHDNTMPGSKLVLPP